jgi:hypothetical protein
MPEGRSTAQTLREQAERCRRLARRITDREGAQRLLDLALELDERADAEERLSGDKR